MFLVMECFVRRGILLLISAVFFIAGCTMAHTREEPFSVIDQDIVGLPEGLKGRKAAVYLTHRQAKIENGHYEGLLQVKQPGGMFGLSKEQKQILLGHAGETAALSFITELKRQGLDVTYLKEWDEEAIKGRDILITGSIAKLVVNTFGRGFKEGYGSAGNYWEARLYLSGLKVEDVSSRQALFESDISTYAKLQPCPVKIDWSMLTFVNKILMMPLAVSGGTVLDTAAGANSYMDKQLKHQYTLDGFCTTPIEVAGRKAAIEMLTKLK